MSNSVSAAGGDSDSLLDFLQNCRDRADRDARVGALITEHADSIIRKILFARLGNSDAHELEDLRASIVLRLLRRIEKIEQHDGKPIASFPQYVAMIARHTVDDFLRSRFPQRTLFKNRLRYLLTHDPRFAIWTANDRMVCGLTAWRDRDALPPAKTPKDLDPKKLVESLVRFFNVHDAPIDVDALVSLFPIDEGQLIAVDPAETGEESQVLDRLTAKESVTALMREIETLPPRQRCALLLHLRDDRGQSALPLLLLTGVASTGQMARLVSMTTEEFAASWNDLPFDDNRIASLLGATRQQVINLRKCARERLARRARR